MTTKVIRLKWTVHHLQAPTPSYLTDSPSRLRPIMMTTMSVPVPFLYSIISSYCFPIGACIQSRLGISPNVLPLPVLFSLSVTGYLETWKGFVNYLCFLDVSSFLQLCFDIRRFTALNAVDCINILPCRKACYHSQFRRRDERRL